MPSRTAKVVRFPVKDDAVGNEIERIVATADTLIARLQQVFMLVDHAKAKCSVHCDDKLG